MANPLVPDHLRQDPCWEGNVQDAIAAHLVADGAAITAMADTASRAHGIDIIAEHDGKQLLIEVKGYPSTVYATGPNAGQPKKNGAQSPDVWLAKAVFTSIRTRAKHPDSRVAIGLPDMPRYRLLLGEIGDAMTTLEIDVFLVRADASVCVWGDQ